MQTYISDTLVFARRSAAHVRQVPEKLIDVTLQPLMFVLLFAYVFGGAIAVPGGDYKEYLIAGILVQSIAFGIMGPATSIATDLTEGIVDRFRSLPASRSAYLSGHLIAEQAAMTLAIAVMVLTGLIIGWHIDAGFGSAAAGFGLLMLFAFAMLWVGTLLGVAARSTDAVQGILFMVVFPLTFLSNAFVPAGGLPAGLETVAEWNPVSIMVAAVRTLFGNPTALPADAAWPLAHPVLCALIGCALIVAVALPATLWCFRMRTTD
jgi:ABC-2 type transport system permease protein